MHITHRKHKKSMGPDNINFFLLKILLPYVVESLTYVYNLCILQNCFHPAPKAAKVIPLPKTKDLSDPNNFRPISLVSILSKPLERHIHKHLTQFIDDRHLSHPSQSGFRQRHSWHPSLIRVCDSWLAAINHAKFTGAVFLYIYIKNLLTLLIIPSCFRNYQFIFTEFINSFPISNRIYRTEHSVFS